MLAIAIGIAMAVLDGTVVNVALPSIARELGASPSAAVWVINAYQLTIVVLLLPLASLGERLGYRRIYQVGVASSRSARSAARSPRAWLRSSPPASCRGWAAPRS